MNSSLKHTCSFVYRNATTGLLQKVFYDRTQLFRKPYGTWALSGFNLTNAARIQPVLDVEKIISNEEIYIDAIEKRQMTTKPNAKEVAELFTEAKKLNEQRAGIETQKNENAAKVQELVKTLKIMKTASEEVKDMRLKGRELREEYRITTNKFNAINDKLVNLILSLPNLLDPVTPIHDCEVLRDTSIPSEVKPWKFPTEPYWRIARPGLGPQEQFAYGGSAWLELDLSTSCQQHLLNEGFVETGNVDFVRRILLEGACLEPNQFLRIRENTVRGGIAHANYLVGGASFPAFLALFAQSVIYSHECLPIKYFVIGRTYTKPKEGVRHRTIQSSSVQVFVACKNEEQQEEEFLKLASSMEQFYSRTVGISFQSRLLSAAKLRTYEKKKISFVPHERTSAVGDLTTVGDYVSKRLLCCYANEHRVPHFLYMITGRFFDLTAFLRPELPAPITPETLSTVQEDVANNQPRRITGWKIPLPGSETLLKNTSSSPISKSTTDTNVPTLPHDKSPDTSKPPSEFDK